MGLWGWIVQYSSVLCIVSYSGDALRKKDWRVVDLCEVGVLLLRSVLPGYRYRLFLELCWSLSSLQANHHRPSIK